MGVVLRSRGLACVLGAWALSGASLTFTAWAAQPDGDPARTGSDSRAVVDRVAARFYAPETGGSAHPRFVTERVLSFEARLDALGEEGTVPDPLAPLAYERHLKSALDRHVVEELLATLDQRSTKTPGEQAALVREARADLEQRVGGDGPIGIAAEEEGMSADEVLEVFTRRAHAAAYLDRAVTRFLRPQDEQLREVYRTSPHPFRGRPYDEVRLNLSRWFVFERLKVLEAAFLQTARSRITVVVVTR